MIIREAKEKAEQTYQHLIDYAEARWNVIALEISDKTASIATNAIVGVCLAVLGMFFLLFGSMALAFWLSNLVESFALGFLFVAILYAIIGTVVYINRLKWLFLPLMNKFLRMLYRNQDDKLI
jgi:VIT1/CCC1 family predicted Fe2+/Mn2+ transporter